MKLNYAIAGYGNLGKSLEKYILQDDQINLVAVFSRRRIHHPLAHPFEEAASFANNIDVLLLSLGSHNDILPNLHYFKDFNTVDSFDTHAQMERYKAHLNSVKPKKISIYAAGWDPGVLSIVRAALSMGNKQVATFWGEGISQGHSNALRSIPGVLDAVQITQPLPEAKTAITNGKNIPENNRHKRLCYVACVQSDRPAVEHAIRTMPNYFANQQVEVVFCTPQEVRALKQNTHHKGEVVAVGSQTTANAQIDVKNNTHYTAQIMLSYAKALPQLAHDDYCGALSPLDIPLKYIAPSSFL